MEAYKIAHEIFPNESEEFIHHVIWEETGFPEFWNIPEDGHTPEECFIKQLREFKSKKETQADQR